MFIRPCYRRKNGKRHAYGRADRIWVGDRGMVSADNIAFLKQSGRRYIVGTPKSMLIQFEWELLAEDWRAIRDGLEVKLCPSPDGDETFVLCRSRDRREKEKAMHGRFERRIEEGLQRIAAACEKQRQQPLVIAQRLGRLMGQNGRPVVAYPLARACRVRRPAVPAGRLERLPRSLRPRPGSQCRGAQRSRFPARWYKHWYKRPQALT